MPIYRRQRAPHPFGFELEHADRVAALEPFVYARVVPRERVEIAVDPAQREQSPRFLEHRKRLEAEEVEFDQLRGLDALHIELRHRHVRARVAIERENTEERL